MSNTRTAGQPVEDFRLAGIDGHEYESREARRHGLLLFAVYRQGCGTCRYTAPFLQRFHEEYSGEGFQIWGVSQDSPAETREFAERFGLSFPLLPDQDLAVTAAYGLTHVPGIFLVDSGDTILLHAAAFERDTLNGMAQVVAERCGVPFVPIVREEDDAPALKPG